jgi:hypothetical protein
VYSEELGYRLGRGLYDFYIAGKITRGILRNIFLTHLDVPGNAKELCWKLVGKFRRCKPASL